MIITSNYHWRDFKSRDEVPLGVLTTEFDYQDGVISHAYIKYGRNWHHLDQTMRLFPGYWDGSISTSWSTGILIKLSDDGTQYQIASYRL